MNNGAAANLPGFLVNLTRFLFFTGKGGVGKTSIACAAALSLADGGKSVLLVSTDPASNLDEILDVPLGNVPVAVSSAKRLQVLNIDPTAAGEAYRSKGAGPNGTRRKRTGSEHGSGTAIRRLHDRDRFV